jgi:hypothetical protein
MVPSTGRRPCWGTGSLSNNHLNLLCWLPQGRICASGFAIARSWKVGHSSMAPGSFPILTTRVHSHVSGRLTAAFDQPEQINELLRGSAPNGPVSNLPAPLRSGVQPCSDGLYIRGTAKILAMRNHPSHVTRPLSASTLVQDLLA